MTTTVRLPMRIEEALAEYCVSTRRTKSEVIVELLEQRFMGSSTERTPYELACEAGFIACIDGGTKAAKKPAKARVADAIRAKHRRPALQTT
jgi:ADP-ribose pyrophosphatase YjhB (NUDIX family)